MFNKFFKFLKGYVIIEVSGSDIERFLNICVRRDIDVSDVKHHSDGTTVLCISVHDFILLRPVAYKTKTKIKIIERHGAFELKRLYGKRYALYIGALIMVLFFIITAQFVWVVKIDGIYESDMNQIVQILEENGVKPGAFKGSLPEISKIKNALINKTDTVAWAWVYIEGACARVEIYEKRLKSQTVDKSEPCNIVAASDAFIRRVDVRKGYKAIVNETPVSAGDILISGKVPVFRKDYEEERYMYVHAEGDIEAVTYHTEETEQKLWYDSRVKTGQEKKYYSAEIFGKLFNLFFKENPPYEEYDVSDKRHELCLPFFGYTGLCINERTYSEVEVFREPISKEAAALLAQRELEEKIAKKLLKNPQMLSRELEWEDVNSDTIRVRLKMSFIEDIGTEITINKE